MSEDQYKRLQISSAEAAVIGVELANSVKGFLAAAWPGWVAFGYKPGSETNCFVTPKTFTRVELRGFRPWKWIFHCIQLDVKYPESLEHSSCIRNKVFNQVTEFKLQKRVPLLVKINHIIS